MKLFKRLPKGLVFLKIIFTITSLIVWLLLFSILYSVAMPGNFDLKPPEEKDISWEKRGDFLVMDTHVKIINKGLWDITDLNLRIEIKNHTGFYVLKYTKNTVKISHGEVSHIPINIQFNLKQHYERSGDDWLVNDQNLKIEIHASTKYAKGLIEIEATLNPESNWGAPLSGLKIEKPRIVDNKVNTTFSFYNNASYNLDLTVRGDIYDSSDNFLTNVSKIIHTKKKSYFVDSIEIDGKSAEDAEYIKFFFIDEKNFIEYGPIEKRLGGN